MNFHKRRQINPKTNLNRSYINVNCDNGQARVQGGGGGGGQGACPPPPLEIEKQKKSHQSKC